MREHRERETGMAFNFDRSDLSVLREYLAIQRIELEALMNQSIDKKVAIHVVLGNESADLDSVVSSIVRAYHLYLESDKTGIILPYINMFREELMLRKDVIYLFQNLGITEASLFFIDDRIGLDQLAEAHELNLHLVDHNQLNPDQEHLASRVIDIIDHHVDSGAYPALTRKIIKTIGSCTTLIANELFKTLPLDTIPKAFAALILAPVLMDTDNLLSLEKTTEADLDLAQALCLQIGDDLPADFYNRLRKEKSDISGIAERVLFFKDFKKFEAREKQSHGTMISYGMSSMVSSKGFWTDSETRLREDFDSVLKNRGLNLHLLLMPYSEVKEDPRRKIVVYSDCSQLTAAFHALLQLSPSLQSRLTLQDIHSDLYFYTTEKFISRKELQPLIDSLLSTNEFMQTFRESRSVHACEKKTVLKRSHDDLSFFSGGGVIPATSNDNQFELGLK